MSGDMAGGASALKTALGGVDINSMNAFQKQSLSQATGMDINELMNLTQSKGGGAAGTISEKNAAKTGASIANGALNQDIANEAAKLKLEQKFRKESLEFEQKERLQMLGVEQQMRLQGIALEQSFRIKAATLAVEQDVKDLQNKFVKEVMSEQVISGLSSQYKNAPDVARVQSKTQGVGVTPIGSISYTNLADSTKKGGQPTVAAIDTQSKLQDTKLTQQITKQAALLTESAYSVKLQQEMVAMLGLSTQMLGKIMDNTANGTDVTLDGKSLRQSLLNQARRNYGVARTA
jgi:hypothetical protein